MVAARTERAWPWALALAGALAFGVLLVRASPPAARAAGCLWRAVGSPSPDSLSIVSAPEVWRFGAGVSALVDQDFWLPRLGAGWYLDWRASDRPGCAEPEHWQMVRVHPDGTTPTVAEARRLAARHPGQVWIIGNEPDVASQDGVTYERYARAYHDLYTALKSADPAARVAVGGVAQATPLRLRYLEGVLRTYLQEFGRPLPVDVWTVHGYVLNEARGEWGAGIPVGLAEDAGARRSLADHGDLQIFAAQILAFRRWMREHGYRQRPLALTEYGILLPPEFGYPVERTAGYLTASFDWLRTAQDDRVGYPLDDNHLVQRWAWFSLADPVYPASNLIDPRANEPTLIGQAFRAYVGSLADEP